MPNLTTTPRFIVPSSLNSQPSTRHHAKLVTRGSVTIRVTKSRWYSKKHRKHYHSFILAWRAPSGKRLREKRNTKTKAFARADELATQLANLGTVALDVTPADIASLLRTRQILAKIGNPDLELVASIYTESVQILEGRDVLTACKSHAAANPLSLVTRNSSDLVTDLVAKRKLCSKWERNLKTILDRFAAKFPEPLNQLQARPLDDWLDSLKLGLRTRRNYLNAVAQLARFAQDRGYLTKDWSILDAVSNPEPAPAHINLYTPDELVRLLNKAETYKAGTKLVPLIAITAFAGVRHGEMNEEKIEALDWGDIDWDTKRIHIDAGAAKRTGRNAGDDRTVDMPDNLVDWLAPYRKTCGRICELSNTSNALCRLRTRAGIAGPKKNALRKSFITYKLALTRDIAGVADQAGNSAAVIRKNYKGAGHTRMRELAQRWFNIIPTRADVLPLFNWKTAAK